MGTIEPKLSQDLKLMGVHEIGPKARPNLVILSYVWVGPICRSII